MTLIQSREKMKIVTDQAKRKAQFIIRHQNRWYHRKPLRELQTRCLKLSAILLSNDCEKGHLGWLLNEAVYTSLFYYTKWI